eukprot:2347281-Rhodomonas_salina.2
MPRSRAKTPSTPTALLLFQGDRSRLTTQAPENMTLISWTARLHHADMPWTNEEGSEKHDLPRDDSETTPVSHVEMSPFEGGSPGPEDMHCRDLLVRVSQAQA